MDDKPPEKDGNFNLDRTQITAEIILIGKIKMWRYKLTKNDNKFIFFGQREIKLRGLMSPQIKLSFSPTHVQHLQVNDELWFS